MIRSIVLAALGTLTALAVSELALRLAGLPRLPRNHDNPPQFQLFEEPPLRDEIGYTMVPSAEIPFIYDSDPRGYFERGNRVVHKINSLGFRGSEFEPAAGPHDEVVVFLGDSFTLGEGVHEIDTFAARTAALLNEKSRPRFRSLNFGVSGFNTSQQVAVFERFAVAMKPAIAVMAYVLNDAETALFAADASGRIARRNNPVADMGKTSFPDWNPLLRLHLARLIWLWNDTRTRTEQTTEYYRSLYRDGAPGWNATQRAFTRFRELCSAHGVDCRAAILPLMYQLNDYPFRTEHKLVANALRRAGVPVRDLLPVFAGDTDSELWVHPTDHHPNERAHLIIATDLAKWIGEAEAKDPVPADPR